jgi:hypothetical protein
MMMKKAVLNGIPKRELNTRLTVKRIRVQWSSQVESHEPRHHPDPTYGLVQRLRLYRPSAA